MKAVSSSLFPSLAKNHCCNYSATGPLKKQHYCWLGPLPDCTCLVVKGEVCKWFVDAVLPAHPRVHAAWVAAQDPKPIPRSGKRCADCGKLYTSRANRASRCPECTTKARVESMHRRNQKRKKD